MTTVLATCLLFALGGLRPAPAQTRYEAKWESLDKRPCPQWFLDRQVRHSSSHWGVYSVPSWGKVGRVTPSVLEPDLRQEAEQRVVAVPQSGTTASPSSTRISPPSSARAVRCRQVGRRFRPLRRQVHRAHLEAPRGFLPVAQRRGEQDLGPPVERRRDRPQARSDGRAGRRHA